MTGAFRYITGPDCVRHWHWFARVGRPEAPLIGGCVRAIALAVPLMVPGSVWLPKPLPLLVVVVVVVEAAYGPGWGSAGTEYAPGFGAGTGYAPGYGAGFAGGGVGIPSVALPLPQGSASERGEQAALGPQTWAVPAVPTAAGGYPATDLNDFRVAGPVQLADSGPTAVPEPLSSAAILGLALAVLAGVRRIQSTRSAGLAGDHNTRST